MAFFGLFGKKDSESREALDKGLLLLTAKDKVRLLPPLTIEKAELEKGMKILINILEG